MTDPLVSIIIPTFNNAEFITQAIESVLNQTYQGFEIIVIDDGSTDQTENILSKFGDRITYIKQNNRGPSSARNAGIKKSSGKYIAFLDSDDLFLPNKLSIQINFLVKHPEIDLVYSNGFRFRLDEYGNEVSRKLSETGELIKGDINNSNFQYKLMEKNIFPVHASLVKRECLEIIGGFDETLTACEDWDLWYRIAEKYNIAYLDEFLIKYRDINDSNSSDFIRNFQEVDRVMEKISKTPTFLNSPKKVKSGYYFHRGINMLNLKESEFAKNYFFQSYSYNRTNIKSLVGFLLIFFFGNNTIKLISIKRKFLGTRGRKQI